MHQVCKLHQFHGEEDWVLRLVSADGRVHGDINDGDPEHPEGFE